MHNTDTRSSVLYGHIVCWMRKSRAVHSPCFHLLTINTSSDDSTSIINYSLDHPAAVWCDISTLVTCLQFWSCRLHGEVTSQRQFCRSHIYCHLKTQTLFWQHPHSKKVRFETASSQLCVLWQYFTLHGRCISSHWSTRGVLGAPARHQQAPAYTLMNTHTANSVLHLRYPTFC